MGRIRTIKPDFFKHFDLYEAEKESGLPLRLTYISLWTICDRQGRFRWKVERLKIECLPFDNIDFGLLLNTLREYGYIVKYQHEKEQYGFIPTFEKHQYINNKEFPSELPDPQFCNVSTD